MFDKDELDMLADALFIKFSASERLIEALTDKIYAERKKQEQDKLLTLLLKTINLSDTAQ